MLKKILFSFLCTFIGAVFIFSGYTKLYPIEPFEYTFVDLGFINWQIAPFIARAFIALEFFIGIVLALNINLRKIAYKAAIGLLVIFSVYLLLLILFSGNKGNCGCFGSVIAMTPLQALIKNIIILIVLGVLYKYHPGRELKNKWNRLVLFIFAGAVAMPFVLNPVELNYSEAYLNKPEDNYKIELDTLYNNATLTIPPKTLSEGKKIIAFLSLTCQHCRIAANKMRIMHTRNSSLPFYFVLNGKNENLEDFFENTHTKDIPYCMLSGRHFIYLAGTSLPSIYLVNNSKVEHEVNYMNLDQEEVENWLIEKEKIK